VLIVLALVIGAAFGAAAHFALPGRSLRGAALGPIGGAALGALAWTALTWSGLGPDSVWVWLVSALLPAIVVPLALTALTRARARADQQTRSALGI